MGILERIDLFLLEKGFVESRSQAQRLIMAGQVRVDGQVVLKSSKRVAPDVHIDIEALPKYVSRGGDKLASVLDHYPITVHDRICADVGASTGGFTDCLLQHGAARVYAIDVGHGVLHWRLRNDTRVVVMERTNARKISMLPELVGLVTIDASFISLRTLLPVIRKWLLPGADLIALIKPQFEAGKKDVGKQGVVRDPVLHQKIVERIVAEVYKLDLQTLGVMRSPLIGPKGNVEFFIWCRNEPGKETFELSKEIFQVV